MGWGSMTIDIEKARRETPGCAQVLHFNNAGAGLMPQPVLDSMVRHLQLEAQIGGYEAEAVAHTDIEHSYDSVARLLNCHRDEVAIIENATRAWDMAFYSIPFKPGDRILTARAEYGSNYLAYLQIARRYGASVEIIPNDQHGQISTAALRSLLDKRVKLIAVTHIPTNGGLVNPAAEIGKIAREAGVLYLLDACQSVGQMPIDVEQIGCDFLSATGRKFLRGPRAVGFLYVRREILEQLEPVFLDIHAATWTGENSYEIRPDARRFENWETNFATKIGLGVAIDYALGWGIDLIRSRVTALADTLREQLGEIPGVTVRDLGVEKCGIVTFTVERKSATDIKTALAAKRINTAITRRSSTLLDMDERQLTEMVRASVHYYNTESEIERFCAEIRGLVGS